MCRYPRGCSWPCSIPLPISESISHGTKQVQCRTWNVHGIAQPRSSPSLPGWAVVWRNDISCCLVRVVRQARGPICDTHANCPSTRREKTRRPPDCRPADTSKQMTGRSTGWWHHHKQWPAIKNYLVTVVWIFGEFFRQDCMISIAFKYHEYPSINRLRYFKI